ncbi:MAG: glycerol-3-phosphate dehydrogenase, partial [Deltaproteobacteria bacterium]|nr:glycerol-3-phosphate dehydrogenase [Deltaproteobacteria bacterium]
MAASLPSPASPPFSLATRNERVGELSSQHFDVLVIGGGITGTGVARDAAMRGLKVALLEAGDLATGTSSASSKLVHGGLRYLEQGNVRLVLESVSERARLMTLAPHLVRPMPFFFPVYRKKPRPLWMVGLGLWIYETLAMFRVPARHRTLRGAAARREFPGLTDDGLDGGVVFWDCATDDARLVLETAISAHEAGAWVLPRMRVEGFLTERGQVTGAHAKDALTGVSHSVSARVVVNATGPWTDRTLGLKRQRARLLRPTKGTHIVLRRDRLPLDATVMLRTDDGFIFAIPTEESVFVGTSDTDYSGDYDRVRATGDEVTSFLEHLNRAFPQADLGPDDVIGSWAGLRPLLTGGDDDTRELPRDHEVVLDDDGLVSVAGGKLTTYRLMAEEVVDRISERLASDGMHIGRSPTGAVRLPGGVGVERRRGELSSMGVQGRALDETIASEFGRDVADHLRRTYGGRWPGIIDRARADERLGLRIDPELPYLWAEVDHAVENELACTIVDVMRRRTQLILRSRDMGANCVADVGARMAQLLGWSA